MKIGIYGGTFNPPHTGHIRAAEATFAQLKLDRLLIVPAGMPPHKQLPASSPDTEDRLEMTRLAFAELKGCEVLDFEIKRSGKSYTRDTIRYVKDTYPDAQVFLLIGSDMLLTLEEWFDHEWIMQQVTVAVFRRGELEDDGIEAKAAYLIGKYQADIRIIRNPIVFISSSQLREELTKRSSTQYLPGNVYAYLIKKRLYGAKPNFDWLRSQAQTTLKPSRIPHVNGCELEAVNLAKRWGADPDEAREAAILHDITKKFERDEQLLLCAKYGIITDNVEREEYKLLHSKTGAAVAFHEFGVSPAVHDAIFWHTTGKASMTILEKIIYLADYIEPTRKFDGVQELRTLAYEDLDRAMALGLKMSVDDMENRGIIPHRSTMEAIHYLL